MRSTLLHLATIALAVAAVFWNTLPNGLYFDDQYLVLDNPGIRELHPVWRHFVDPSTISVLPRITQYRPLLPLTLSLSYRLGGSGTAGHHVGNFLCHLAACFAVYALAREMIAHWSAAAAAPSSARRLALVVALLTAVHPVAGFCINYISARDLLLMQAFLVSALVIYVRMRRRGSTLRGWCAVLGFFALALLSKTDAAVAPLVVVGFEVTTGRESLLSRRPWLRAVPFVAVVGLHVLWKRSVLGFSDLTNAFDPASSPWSYAVSQAAIHPLEYVKNFVWPFAIRLTPRIDVGASLAEPAVWLGVLCIGCSIVCAWSFRRRHPVTAFCVLAYWILLGPSSSVLPLYYEIAHYRPYPSMAFLFLGLGIPVCTWLAPRWRLPIALALVGWFGFVSFTLNRTWLDAETAWGHSVQHGGEAVAHMNYALALPERSGPAVLEHMQTAVRLEPNSVLAVLNLGLLHIDRGDAQQGIALVEQAQRLASEWGQVHHWVSIAYSRIGRDDLALASALEAARLEPRSDQHHYTAATLLQRAGQYAESLEPLDRIVQHSSRYDDALLLRGLALQKLGRNEEAIAVYERLLERREGDAQAHFNLAYAHMETGDDASAIEHFERTLVLRPEYREAHFHLAFCFDRLGKTEEAGRHRLLYDTPHEAVR